MLLTIKISDADVRLSSGMIDDCDKRIFSEAHQAEGGSYGNAKRFQFVWDGVGSAAKVHGETCIMLYYPDMSFGLHVMCLGKATYAVQFHGLSFVSVLQTSTQFDG